MHKILIIEDEKELAMMIQKRLGQEGYLVEAAYDGEEGLAKAKSFKPDLIILDLIIPQIDGYKLCEMLKTDEKYKHIKILMLTGRSSEIEEKAGFAVGADDYLVKPYEADVLLKKIKDLLA